MHVQHHPKFWRDPWIKGKSEQHHGGYVDFEFWMILNDFEGGTSSWKVKCRFSAFFRKLLPDNSQSWSSCHPQPRCIVASQIHEVLPQHWQQGSHCSGSHGSASGIFFRSFSASQSTQRLVSIPCTSACQESCRWGHSLLLWPTTLQWLEMRLPWAPWASRRKSASVVPLFLVSIFGEETSRRYVGQVPSFYAATVDMIQCEAPKISKLVYNSNNYGLWYL